MNYKELQERCKNRNFDQIVIVTDDIFKEIAEAAKAQPAGDFLFVDYQPGDPFCQQYGVRGCGRGRCFRGHPWRPERGSAVLLLKLRKPVYQAF